VTEPWIVDAVRTPVGRYGGALAGVRPDDLAATVLRSLLSRTGLDPTVVDDVVLGCGNQAGEDNRNVARMASLLAGLPVEVPGVTVNRLCGSGAEAVAQAARAILAGDAQVVVAGGVESMSRAPLVTAKAERAFPRGPATAFDTALGWRFVNPLLHERYGTESMGETAENLAEAYAIPRAAQDAFALASHKRAVAATASGRLGDELVAVPAAGGPVVGDEGPRPDTTLDRLAALPPVFRTPGTVTAGNSSPLSDGAAALLLASRDFARAHGLRPLARVRASATAGVPPRIMGIGPVPATAKVLERAGLELADIDRIELNEAFAAQVLAVLEEWKTEPGDPRLNPNGGAIAIGHPIGCSGARLLTTLVYELRRSDVTLGLATMCIGVGQGIAVLVERVA
jgi:acetyl-CoA acyltransferase